MSYRRKYAPHVKEAIRAAGDLIPTSGDVDDLLKAVSESRGRPMTLLSAPLESAVSGLLISTNQADYVVVAEGASPERQAAIICHEVAHALLGHDHSESAGEDFFESGMLRGVDPDLARSVVAARHAYAHTDETDAETVATHISIELRRRVMRGGHTYYDERWW